MQVKEVSAGAGQLETSRIRDAILHAMHATTGPIVIVTDGNVGSGLQFTGWDEALAAHPERCVALIDALVAQGLTRIDATTAVGRVHLVSLPWNLREQTEALLSDIQGVHPSVASFTVGALYEAFGMASADQRHLSLDQARTLTVGDVDTALHVVQSAVDVTGLDAAVSAGVCRPADYSTTRVTSASRFYLGVDGAPIHIAQGLDVIRADEMDQITQAAQEGEYTVIVGPSGSGKSVLLWRASRDVILGARVVRVARVTTDEDGRLLVRHVELLRATATSPVVVAADNLGRPSTSAWPNAVASLREIPHVFVIGAAREEDFSPRLLNGSTRVIRPLLDRLTAELIAERVERAELTTKMATAEALARSDGLLMEFLSLLREGKHLEQVLASQAAELAAPGREIQREAARLVLAAHAVGLSLTARMLGDALAAVAGSNSAVGDALAILKNEHVVLDYGDIWTGLHELRSQTLTTLLHDAPPPTLGETLSVIARLLPADEAGWLLRRSAERYPETIVAVAGAVAYHLHEPGTAASGVAELLEGAERADNVAYATACLSIIRRLAPSGVSPTLIAPFVYGIRNQDTALDPIGSPAFDRAATQITRIARALPPRSSPVLEAITTHLDSALVVRLLTAGTLVEAVRLLEALAGTVPLSASEAAAVFREFDEPTNATQADAWARLIDALSRFVSAENREATFGTVEHRALVIAQSEPSAVALTMQTEVDPSVTVMHGLDVQEQTPGMTWDVPSADSSDALNDFVVALARQLAFACPEANHVEVITITPSGRRYRAGEFEPGFKHMAREVFKERAGVRRNVGFQGAIRMLSAAPTWTALLQEQAQIAQELVNLAGDGTFRLRANDPSHQAQAWAERVQAASERAGVLASKPKDGSKERAASHASEDDAQRQNDPVSQALGAAAQALINLRTNDNRVAVAMSLRDAAAKVEHARSLTPTYFGLDQPVPDALGTELERLARAAISAVNDPDAWRSVRFGDHATIDAITASSAIAVQQQQHTVLSEIKAAVPGAVLRTVPDPAPFPSSIDQTGWLVTAGLQDWEATVDALARIDAEARHSLDCNVWVLAVDGVRPLPLAVFMARYGEQSVLPLAGESFNQLLTAAGLTLAQTADTAIEKIRELTAWVARASWTLALYRRRPVEWPATVPVPTADELAGISVAARTAVAQLPNTVGPVLGAALDTLATQVELELQGPTEVTLAGELIDVVNEGPTAAAIDAGIWQALTNLSLTPAVNLQASEESV
ncbi:hypothetical protein WDU99_00140 [Microbacterium sp. Mu-80]|uniref:ATP-binding protein n=1 Tax=Microbacterium bandirmense TaxID=3122050 RepID=A0ABU8L5X6_9MICO